MGIYWLLVALVLFLGAPIQPYLSKDRAKIYLSIVFVLLLIVSGFRAFSVGADTKTYVDIFNNIGDLAQMKKRYEIGFLYYVKMLHALSSNPGILVFVSSAICIGAACIFTYRFSRNPMISLVLYILLGSYFSQMNVMRQAIAVSIIEIAFIVLLQEKERVREKIISLLLILLATTFHTIAIAGIIPWGLTIISNRRDNRKFTANKMLKVTILFAGIAFLLFPVIIAIAGRVLPKYYADYFNSSWGVANYNAPLFNTLIQMAFACVGAIVLKDKQLNKKQRFAVIMLSLTTIFYVLSMRMVIWERIAAVYGIYTYLLWVPEITATIDNTKNRVMLSTAVVLFSVAYMLIILLFRPEWTLVVPYQFR